MTDLLNEEQLLKMYPWITKEFFENCLRNEQPNVIVNEFTIKSALAKGENYSSQMIRANVLFQSKEKTTPKTTTIMIKAELKETAELLSEFNLLSNEITVYKQILPKTYELLNSINDYSRLSSKCFDCKTNPFYLAFEDLTASGYKNTNRNDGFNYQHFQCVLLKLAKWHATTAVLMEKNSSLFESHMNPFLQDDDNSNKSDTMFSILKNTLFTCAEVVKHWNGYELIAEKLIRTAQTSLRRKAIRAYGRNDEEFNVLSHGDLWCNNIMFKETGDGNLEDAIMVDYANCCWGSPGNDLTYLLFTSSDSTVQEHEWDTLIMYYYENLMTILSKLKYNGIQPTLTDINCDFVKRGLCSAIISIILIPIRKLENADDITISVFVNDSPENNILRNKVIGNPKCKEELQYRLDYFNRKGYFD